MESSRNKTVVIITLGWFPEGDAGAVRLFYNAKALTEAGYAVRVLCRGKVNDSGCIDGIEYISLRTQKGNRLLKLLDYKRFTSRVKKQLEKTKELSAVYIYNAPRSVFKYCKFFCTDRKISLIHDCVEWYSPEEFKLGKYDRAYRTKNEINTKIIDQSFSVVAISRFLEEYYKSKGIRTIRLPILCDAAGSKKVKKNGEKLTLFYAGSPVKKDLVGNVLKAALLLTEEERQKLQIVFVGVTKSHLISKCEIPKETIDACADVLELCGRVSRTEVLKRMDAADFTILVRDASLRYAQAGFPSKVVESLANATPVLCNYSSDLELYLHDGKNALIAEDHSPEALLKTIRRALALSPEEKSRMSYNARESAEKYFDYRKYSAALRAFLENE